MEINYSEWNKENFVKQLSEEYSKCVKLSQVEKIYSLKTDFITFLVSPNGNRIAISPAVGNLAIIIDRQKLQKEGKNYQPKVIPDILGFFWSPNSRYLLFLTLNRRGTFGQVQWGIFDSLIDEHYILHSFRITNTFGNNYLPFFSQYASSTTFFSPDSEWFVFCESSDVGVWICNVKKGSIPKRIANGIFATWSPI